MPGLINSNLKKRGANQGQSILELAKLFQQPPPGIPGTPEAPGTPGTPDPVADATSLTLDVKAYEPKKIQFDPATDTIEGRVQNIIKKNSPIMQLAGTRAKQLMNQTGLLNTSMAIGEGQMAVMDKAIPMAYQDSLTSMRLKELNVGAENEAARFNIGAENIGAIKEFEHASQQEIIQQEYQLEDRLQRARGREIKEIELLRMDNARQLLVTDIAGRERLLAQQGELNKDLALLEGQQQLAQIKAGGVEASRLQERKAVLDKEISLLLQRGDIAGKMRLTRLQGELNKEIETLRWNREADLIVMQGDIRTQLQRLIGTQDRQLTAQEGLIRADLIKRQGVIDKERDRIRGALDKDLQMLRGTQAMDLAKIEGDNDLLMQTSRSAAVVFSQASASIAAILAEPNMTLGAKQQLVDQIINLLRAQMAVIGGMGGYDINSLLVFGNEEEDEEGMSGSSTGTPVPRRGETRRGESTPQNAYNWSVRG